MTIVGNGESCVEFCDTSVICTLGDEPPIIAAAPGLGDDAPPCDPQPCTALKWAVILSFLLNFFEHTVQG